MTQNSVELIGFYGNDKTHALSAWTSTSRELDDDKLQRIPNLLKYLADNKHLTPFEKSYFHFLVRCDVASHIHLLKHRIGVSINAESARYKQLKDVTFYIPDDWPLEDKENEQPDLGKLLENWTKQSQYMYEYVLPILEKHLGRSRAKESARYFLPYATQLTMDVGFNFRSLYHFLNLRLHPHAQLEIREIAGKMLGFVKQTGKFEHTLKAFNLDS